MRHEQIFVPDRGAAEPISAGAALLAGKKVAPDAINLLILDHLEAMSVFERYERSTDPAEKAKVLERLCILLSTHMQVEEEIFYPAAQDATGDQPKVEHAREEHDEAKALIAQLQGGGAPDDAVVRQLREAIQHHVAEEETSFFPEVRTTDLDLFAVGRRVAARRVELLFDRTGRTPTEGMMDVASDMDVAMTGNIGRETQATPVSPDEARKLFVTGLKNAHATENECRTMVQRQLDRLEQYPKLKARLTQHLGETERQIERLDQILEGLGENASGVKDAALSMAANAGSMMHAAAGDEVLKNSMANAALAQFEIAAYKSLLVLGSAAGETGGLRLLQQSLNEERAMAAWLEENLTGTVIAHLQLRSQGEQASH